LKVDAHHHFINLDEIEYAFLNPGLEKIYRNFGPSDLQPLLNQFGIDKTIVVQAQNGYDETEYLLDVANKVDWIAGVVGWVPLDRPTEADSKLKILTNNPKFKGVRHLLFEEKEDWLITPKVIEGLKVLASYNVLFEIPAEYPNHLHYIPTLMEEIPDLKVVIDHLAKPPIHEGKISKWSEQLEKAAKYPNVYAKVSGLNTATADAENWTAEDLRPYIDVAFDLFGHERLMFGSDWPVACLAGDYKKVWNETNEILKKYSLVEQDAVLGLNTLKVYNLLV